MWVCTRSAVHSRFALLLMKLREKKGKSSNTKQPLFIYNSSATLKLFAMLRYTIRILSHDLTHHQHNSYQYNHATSSDVATPQTTFLSYQIMPPPLHCYSRNTLDHFLIITNNAATTTPLFPCLPTSPLFRNTNSFNTLFLKPHPISILSLITLNLDRDRELATPYDFSTTWGWNLLPLLPESLLHATRLLGCCLAVFRDNEMSLGQKLPKL